MYKCKICQHVSGPRTPRKVHVVYREVIQKMFLVDRYAIVPRKEIEREIPVCVRCDSMLKLGCTLEQVIQQRGRDPEPKTPKVKVVEYAPPVVVVDRSEAQPLQPVSII